MASGVDYFEDNTVSINMVLGALVDSLTAEERKPINEPNMLSVQDFRNKLANLLLKYPSNVEDTGHTNVVETLDGHRRRIGDTTGTTLLPTPPAKPTLPAYSVTSHLWRVYEIRLRIFKTYR